jgi:hypothetical protein
MPRFQIGDRVEPSAHYQREHWGAGTVRHISGDYVSWLTDNGTGDRAPRGNGVPCVHASDLRTASEPGVPRRYGPYKPIAKALPG